MSKKNKKNWIRPQIKIVCKSTPEESVLSACKRGDAYFQGPIGGNYCVYTGNTSWVSCKDGFSS